MAVLCRGANVAINIASALHYLEANQIFHGDIKCAVARSDPRSDP